MSPVSETRRCNILLLDHPQFTHGTYFLWHGLKEIEFATFAKVSVDVYPHIPTHYDVDSFNLKDKEWYQELERLVARKELPPGIPAFAPGEQLTYHGQEVINHYGFGRKFHPYHQTLGASNMVETKPLKVLTETEVVQDLNAGHYDLVILGNSHRVPTILLGRLLQKVARVNMPPIVYYDAGERDELNEHWVHVFRPDLTFKQILTPEVEARGLTVPIQNYDFTIVPLPLSSILVDYPDTYIGDLSLKRLQDMSGPGEKMLDIFYPMGNTWDARQEVLETLDAITKNKNLNKIGPVTYANFHLALAKTRMAVTMRGSGRDTLRYWEIPLYRTAMVSDGTMGCIHPYPFEGGKTALFWSNVGNLASLVLTYLAKDGPKAKELIEIADAGKKHLDVYHSTLARALFFLDRIEEHLAINAACFPEVQDLKKRRGWDSTRPWRGPVA